MYWDTTPPRTRLPALLTGETSPTSTSALLHKNRALHNIYDVYYRRERKASVLVTRVDTGGSLLSLLCTCLNLLSASLPYIL